MPPNDTCNNSYVIVSFNNALGKAIYLDPNVWDPWHVKENHCTKATISLSALKDLIVFCDDKTKKCYMNIIGFQAVERNEFLSLVLAIDLCCYSSKDEPKAVIYGNIHSSGIFTAK